jgi:hypothetical protein
VHPGPPINGGREEAVFSGRRFETAGRGLAMLIVAVGMLNPALGDQSTRRSPCDQSHPSDRSIVWTCRPIGEGESLERMFGADWVHIARFNRIDRRHITQGLRIKVPNELTSVRGFTPMPALYPPAERDSQFVLVVLSEQFLGGYEWGRLVFSAPIAAGRPGHPTPHGWFQITAYDRNHVSSIYDIADTERPYPMHYGLRFHVDAAGMAYWIHGRDLPGFPMSHGCIGLYDEAMQKQYFGSPAQPVMDDARRLFLWVVGSRSGTVGFRSLRDGPRVLIVESLADSTVRLMSARTERRASGADTMARG